MSREYYLLRLQGLRADRDRQRFRGAGHAHDCHAHEKALSTKTVVKHGYRWPRPAIEFPDPGFEAAMVSIDVLDVPSAIEADAAPARSGTVPVC